MGEILWEISPVLICCLSSCNKEQQPEIASEILANRQLNAQSNGPMRFKKGTEPDGFRGIKWGTKISDLKDRDKIGRGSGASLGPFGWIDHDFIDRNLTLEETPKEITVGFLFYNESGPYNAPDQLFGAVRTRIASIEKFLIFKVFLVLKFGHGETGSMDNPEIPCLYIFGFCVSMPCFYAQRRKSCAVTPSLCSG